MRLTQLVISPPRRLLVLALCALLSGCFAPMVAMAPTKLMWSFIKPFVGLDPSRSQLFEQPLIKNRMTELLGDEYEETLALLRSAPALKQEGTLFYLASPTDPATEKTAGLVWNAQTNKMSALVNDGTTTQLFLEPNSTAPVVWPTPLAPLVDPQQSLADKKLLSPADNTDPSTETERALKAAQARLKALQDEAELKKVQAQISELEAKAATSKAPPAAKKRKESAAKD
ncbi:hypothetical protein [Oceanisphaera avium]|uniref:Uncharacterized protein n=1 Tax=Oceanisphaera avium TaxID=1903694 RepID=A0A1Y0CX38_9GAMM|nr:hypothetical protein [Oceanisphaera avium]ART79901.1 hypothetical protein CBP12_06835 [Oceanisphaera avium]